jgi:hypothetical protein
MTDGKDLTTEVAKEVAKQLPVKEVYSDIVAPGAKRDRRPYTGHR